MESELKTVLLILDESGAKGYDNNREQSEGELGVMAGFAVPQSQMNEFVKGLAAITNEFQHDGKLHITDLPAGQQELLRQSLFKYLEQCRVCWFYEAIYVEGFHDAHQCIKGLAEQANSSRRANIKFSLNPTKESLHGELFFGAFGTGVAMVTDLIGAEFHLKVVTDRVDESILKLFRQKADQLLNVGQPTRTVVSGFDTEKKQVVRGAVETNVVGGMDALGDFSKVSYSIECQDNLLTLVADVLANSVLHHLSQRQVPDLGSAINTQSAIEGHPLASLVYGAQTCETSVSVADTIFRYPN